MSESAPFGGSRADPSDSYGGSGLDWSWTVHGVHNLCSMLGLLSPLHQLNKHSAKRLNLTPCLTKRPAGRRASWERALSEMSSIKTVSIFWGTFFCFVAQWTKFSNKINTSNEDRRPVALARQYFVVLILSLIGAKEMMKRPIFAPTESVCRIQALLSNIIQRFCCTCWMGFQIVPVDLWMLKQSSS